MQSIRSIFGWFILVSIFGLSPVAARADGEVEVAKRMPEPTSAAAVSFQSFCKEWMNKLNEREVRNRALARAVSQNEQLVMRYTGYGKAPLKCEVRETGVPSQPFVGRLTYDEIEYQKAAPTTNELAAQQPVVHTRTEVMEIFRYDGKKWVY